MNNQSQTQMSPDTKNLIVILLLLFMYPIGIILMYLWTPWPKWVKILITLPIIFLFVALAAAIALVVSNPAQRIMVANCKSACQEVYPTDADSCATSCTENNAYGVRTKPAITSYMKAINFLDEADGIAKTYKGAEDDQEIARLLKSAVSEAKNVTKEDPTSGAAWLLLGNINYELQDYIDGADVEAKRAYEKALMYIPEEDEIYSQLKTRISEFE